MTINELKEYIYKQNKIQFILEQLGCHEIRYNEKRETWSASQPDGDNPQGINIRNNEYLDYRSFSRNVSYDDGKDLISLIEDIKKLSFIDALKYLHKILGLPFEFTRKEEKKPDKPSPNEVFRKVLRSNRNIVNADDIHVLDEELLNDFEPMLHIDWLREGITNRARERFNICYSYKRKRIVIPIYHWATKELVGFNMRTVIPNYEEFGIPKYWITPTYQKSNNLYGLAQNYDAIISKRIVTVFEGEKSTLQRFSLMDDTCVSLQGKTMSLEQARILIGLNAEVVVALDKDLNINEVRNICEKFYHIRPVSYIWDKWGLLDSKDAPVDKGNKIYQFLFKHRVKYDDKEHSLYLKSLERKN